VRYRGLGDRSEMALERRLHNLDAFCLVCRVLGFPQRNGESVRTQKHTHASNVGGGAPVVVGPWSKSGHDPASSQANRRAFRHPPPVQPTTACPVRRSLARHHPMTSCRRLCSPVVGPVRQLCSRVGKLWIHAAARSCGASNVGYRRVYPPTSRSSCASCKAHRVAPGLREGRFDEGLRPPRALNTCGHTTRAHVVVPSTCEPE
jgi:hypothetical protein